MSNVNTLGFGAPLVQVLNSQDFSISNITGFFYLHSEDADDKCTIAIESTDPAIVDSKFYQESSKLTVFYGYIKGSISRKRIVYICDIKVQYKKSSVKLTLTCYDKLSLTGKQNTSQEIHEDVTIEDLAKKIAKRNGLEYNSLLIDSGGLRLPTITQVSGDIRLAVDNTSVPFDIGARGYTQLPQGNKSDYQILKELADREPGGPYVVTGRDDELVVKKRDLTQPAIKTYRYGGGNYELLNFTVQTKNRLHKAASTNVEVSGVDGETGTSTQANSNAVTTESEDYLGSSIPGSPRANVIDDNVGTEEGSTLTTEQLKDLPKQFQQYLNEKESIITLDGYSTAARSTTAGVITIPVIDYTVHEDTVETDPEHIKAVGDNRKAEEALRKNPAVAKVLGDPALESGKVITILGISNRYSGNYYIVEALHDPYHSTGYITTLKLVKNALGKSPNSTPSDIKTSDLPGYTNKTVGPDSSYPVDKLIQTTSLLQHQKRIEAVQLRNKLALKSFNRDQQQP